MVIGCHFTNLKRISIVLGGRDGTDLTLPEYWPAENKGPFCLWPGFFDPTLWDFFYLKGKPLKNLGVLQKIFKTQRRLTRPHPSRATKKWSDLGQNFWWDPSLLGAHVTILLLAKTVDPLVILTQLLFE